MTRIVDSVLVDDDGPDQSTELDQRVPVTAISRKPGYFDCKHSSLITSMRSATATLIDASFDRQTTLKIGKQPMDGAFHKGLLFVACQGDGSIHIIDTKTLNVVCWFSAGVGCETLAFF